MSVDFGCIETCIFPDFEDYVERFELEGMSAEEEDYLDYLLGDEIEEIQRYLTFNFDCNYHRENFAIFRLNGRQDGIERIITLFYNNLSTQ
jgi:hypothetical protein